MDRFSNLETRQSATIDAPLAMELITQAVVAWTRVGEVNPGKVQTYQGDFRTLDLGANPGQPGYDVILAAVVLHHLRDDQDWQGAFQKIYNLTASGGSVWITDLVSHETSAVLTT